MGRQFGRRGDAAAGGSTGKFNGTVEVLVVVSLCVFVCAICVLEIIVRVYATGEKR